MINRCQKILGVIAGLALCLHGAAPLAAGDQQPAEPVPAVKAPAPVVVTPSAVDITAVIHETQKMSTKPKQLTMVWWLPEEYFRIAVSNMGRVNEEQLEAALATIRPYVLLGVVDGKLGTPTSVTYRSEPDLRAAIQLIDTAGTVYSPLPDDEVGPDARSLLAAMRPVISSMLGSMGENLHFFVFQSKGKPGKAIADAKSEGKLTVRLNDESFVFRLPLGSLIPQKMCPQDKEILSGAWTYCPWHGVKLVAAQK